MSVNNNVKFYKVFRNTLANFSTATIIGTPTRTTFTDTPDASTVFYYYVVACNTDGDGVVSDVCVVATAPAF